MPPSPHLMLRFYRLAHLPTRLATELEELTLAARTKVLEFSDQGTDTEAEEEYNNTTTIVAAVVIIILVILMVVFLAKEHNHQDHARKHKVFDDVHGTCSTPTGNIPDGTAEELV